MSRRSVMVGVVALLLILAAILVLRPKPPPASDGMVHVPAGTFFMGCNADIDSECKGDEKPGEQVSVEAFDIGRTEVTVAEYRRCVDAGACSTEGLNMPFLQNQERPDAVQFCNWGRPGREQDPINCLDWDQANSYCAWTGARLPTEREWEKAARGADGRKYPWGNESYASVGARVANIADESARRQHNNWTVASGYDDGVVETAPVGTYPAGASPYGALDMMGNVYEWTSDELVDGRAVRGGSWDSLPDKARVSNRERYEPRGRNVYLGVRCAR